MANQFGPAIADALGYEKDALVPLACAAMNPNYLQRTQKHGRVERLSDRSELLPRPVHAPATACDSPNLELTRETIARNREKRKRTLLWVLGGGGGGAGECEGHEPRTSMWQSAAAAPGAASRPLVDSRGLSTRRCLSAVQAPLQTAKHGPRRFEHESGSSHSLSTSSA